MSSNLIRILLVALLCKNGLENLRVNQGRKIDITEAPYMARVRIKESATQGGACDGTIISDMHILTAGHCATSESNKNIPNPPIHGPSNYSILIGATDLDYPDQGEVFTVSKVFFREWSSYNDIALLKLSSKIQFDGKTKMPITLISDPYYSPKNRTEAYADGWGTNPQHTYNFLRADVYTISEDECNPKDHGHNRTYQICTFGDEGAGPCEGDSGGPLIRSDDGVQIGIVSIGPNADCDDPSRGAVIYTSVARNLQWIRCKMLDNGKNDQSECGGSTSLESATAATATITTTRKSVNFFGIPIDGFFPNFSNKR